MSEGLPGLALAWRIAATEAGAPRYQANSGLVIARSQSVDKASAKPGLGPARSLPSEDEATPPPIIAVRSSTHRRTPVRPSSGHACGRRLRN